MEVHPITAHLTAQAGTREGIATLARHPAVRSLVAAGGDASALQSLVHRLNGLSLTAVELGRLERAARQLSVVQPTAARDSVDGHRFVAYA